MGTTKRRIGLLFLFFGLTTQLHPAIGSDAEKPRLHQVIPNIGSLTLKNVSAESVQYRGLQAIHLFVSQPEPAGDDDEHSMAIIHDLDFRDGTIELEIAGAPAANSPPESRGFVGIAFRVQPHGTAFEYVYLRPTNGRSNDQLRRNHSTQYASHPDYPFDRLRKENPGEYESYVDLEPGKWIKFKLAVEGRKASLYVHGSDQPCLIVNDLKLGDSKGGIGLWIGQWADGYFAKIRITTIR